MACHANYGIANKLAWSVVCDLPSSFALQSAGKQHTKQDEAVEKTSMGVGEFRGGQREKRKDKEEQAATKRDSKTQEAGPKASVEK